MNKIKMPASIRRMDPLEARIALAAWQKELVAMEPLQDIVFDPEDLAPQFVEAIGSMPEERFAAIFLNQRRDRVGGVMVAPKSITEAGRRLKDETIREAQNKLAMRQKGGIHVFEGGSRTRTTLYPRVLFKEALRRGATGMVLSHNHPGGTALPSPQDRELTRRISDLGESLEVRLIDHIIVTPRGEHASFRKNGWM